MLPEQIETAARLLAGAHASGPIAGLPALPDSMEAAFAIQKRTADLLGEVGGWKHGLLGGRSLACAPVLRASILRDGSAVPLAPNLRIEVETAVLLARPIRAGASEEEIADAIGGVHAAFEFLGSRYARPAAREPIELMADRFSNRAVVIGEELPGWRGRDIADLLIEAAFAGAGSSAQPGMSFAETVAFLGFLAGRAEAMGCSLDAGHCVITGARLGPAAIGQAGKFQAVIEGASVSAEVVP